MDDGWPPLRVFHRQMYIDLVRSYLAQYGTQERLARALGLSGAHLSFLLRPLCARDRPRQRSYWGDVLSWPPYDLAEALTDVKTPSRFRAKQLADQLCSEREQREVLLYHLDRARRPLRRPGRQPARLSPEQAEEVRLTLGDMHHAALHAIDPQQAKSGYTAVWDAARTVTGLLDGSRQPVQLAQVLLILHDAACVLDHAELALGYARQAILVLDAHQETNAGRHAGADHVRLRTNAALAEMLALNHLGLARDAAGVADRAQELPGYHLEPESWLRSFHEQRLRSLRRLPRASIYDAERTADRARELVPDRPVLIAGIETRLVDVYLAQSSPRSRREARVLVEGMLPVALHRPDTSPLRRVQILRTAAGHFDRAGDHDVRDDLLRTCLAIIDPISASVMPWALMGSLTWTASPTGAQPDPRSAGRTRAGR